ncbi:MAG: glycosyltransferase family 4 protein, partial [Chloroflexales bacterium]|nr:glycosyltransferase family 4 protein [Chloroflexales bacterium]
TIESMLRRFDIVHFHALGPSLLSGLPRLSGSRTVVTVHGLDWQREKWGRVASWFLRQCEGPAAKFPNRTIVVSKTLREYFASEHKCKTVFIPNGTTLPKPRPAKKILQLGLEPGKYILFVGRLVPEKGVMDLVEALPGLPDNVVVRFVGDGVLRAQIERRAGELELTDRVELHTAVPSTSIPTVLQQLDALALPSHTTANWKEQFGRILIEAMSCGVPVIGAASGEIPNVIGDAGLIVPERNSAALRSAISRLLYDGALRHELRQRGRARVLAHYTQAALARRYYAIYDTMLNSPVSYSLS